MPVTIKDVARLAGVSNATVSRVLTDKPHVRPEIRQRVQEAIQALGYRPSRVARSLRVKRTRLIGLIISDIQNPFFTALVRAVEDVAQQAGYAVILCNSDEDIHKERLYIELMQAEQVSGVLITPTRETGSPARLLLEAGVPVVAVDRQMRDLQVDTVLVDNVEGAFQAVSHLIDAGHTRIGAILAPRVVTTGSQRREGYVQALKAHGLPVDPALIRTGQPRKAVGDRLAGELLDLPERPTALFCGNNLLALGALNAIRERGWRIPEDVALGAFDNLDWAALIDPPLTVVEQPVYELGQTAAELLMKRIQDASRPFQKVELKTRLRVRQSSQRPLSIDREDRR